MKIIMIVDIPPGLILIIGAFIVPLIPQGWLRKVYLLLLPIAGFLSLLSLEHGSFGEVSLFGYELIHVRVDAPLSFLVLFFTSRRLLLFFFRYTPKMLWSKQQRWLMRAPLSERPSLATS